LAQFLQNEALSQNLMKYNYNQKQDGTIDFGVNDVSGVNGELFDQSEREQEGED